MTVMVANDNGVEEIGLRDAREMVVTAAEQELASCGLSLLAPACRNTDYLRTYYKRYCMQYTNTDACHTHARS